MKIFDTLRNKIIWWKLNRINNRNKKRLTNFNPTLICSNCTGGVLYHWLNLRFNSPFINLYMDNGDFLTAMENFDLFMETELIEDKESEKSYPVGIGFSGTRVHFMHYKDFYTANQKWNERKKRINKDNLGIMLTNFGEGLFSESGVPEQSIIQRFNKLPFENKIIFTDKPYNIKNTFYLKGYDRQNLIFSYNPKLNKRTLDQFDYVSFINNLCNKN